MNETLSNRLIDRILNFLTKFETEELALNWKTGATLSSVRNWLITTTHWASVPPGNKEFTILLKDMGFDIVPAKLANGNDHKSVKVISL